MFNRFKILNQASLEFQKITNIPLLSVDYFWINNIVKFVVKLLTLSRPNDRIVIIQEKLKVLMFT